MLTECMHQIIVDDVAMLVVETVMVAITMLSALFAFMAYRHQRNRSKKDAACKLATTYADVILEENCFISNIYESIGLTAFIKSTIDMNIIQEFDSKELIRILAKKNIEYDDFRRKLYSIDPFVILKCRLVRSKTAGERGITYDLFIEKDKNTGEERIRNEYLLIMDLEQDIDDLLNQLECFSMTCRYGLADEELLYQPLHTTFLSMVWMLYPTICMKNVKDEDKAYTNISWLFCQWRKRLTMIKKKTAAKKQRYESEEIKALKKADNARKKADEVKSDEHVGKNV